MAFTSKLNVYEVDSEGRLNPMLKEFPCEAILNLYINGEFKGSFLMSPQMCEDFITGHLICEGFVNSINDIKGFRMKGSNIYVLIKDSKQTEKEVVESMVKLPLKKILGIVEELNKNSRFYKVTKAVHVVGLFNEYGEVLHVAEDIGRHNAVDKVIGRALIEKVDLNKTVLALSGRMPSDMVSKIARAKIPIVISVAYPTIEGVKIARKLNITLITVRDRTYIHSSPERIRI